MCFSIRTEAKDIEGPQWQWRAADQWIPYDLETAQQLESVYTNHGESNCVTLKHGFFADNYGYRVTLDRKNGRHVQTNCNSGGVRSVRRLADDDPGLFQEVSRYISESLCAICQMEFSSSEFGTKDVVKISVCSGSDPHLFHRKCIFQWIKIKDVCPFCKRSVV